MILRIIQKCDDWASSTRYLCTKTTRRGENTEESASVL